MDIHIVTIILYMPIKIMTRLYAVLVRKCLCIVMFAFYVLILMNEHQIVFGGNNDLY